MRDYRKHSSKLPVHADNMKKMNSHLLSQRVFYLRELEGGERAVTTANTANSILSEWDSLGMVTQRDWVACDGTCTPQNTNIKTSCKPRHPEPCLTLHMLLLLDTWSHGLTSLRRPHLIVLTEHRRVSLQE